MLPADIVYGCVESTVCIKDSVLRLESITVDTHTICTRSHTNTHKQLGGEHANIHIHAHTHTYARIHTHARTHARTHACTHAHTRARTLGCTFCLFRCSFILGVCLSQCTHPVVLLVYTYSIGCTDCLDVLIVSVY